MASPSLTASTRRAAMLVIATWRPHPPPWPRPPRRARPARRSGPASPTPRRSSGPWTPGSRTRRPCSTSCSRSSAPGPSTTRSGRTTTCCSSSTRWLAGAARPERAPERARAPGGREASRRRPARSPTELSLNRGVFDALERSRREGRGRRNAVLPAADAARLPAGRRGQGRGDARSASRRCATSWSLIGQDFDRNIRTDLRTVTAEDAAELDGLPADYIARHKPDAERRDHAHHRLPRFAAGVLVREERGPAQADVHGIQQPRVPEEHGGARRR